MVEVPQEVRNAMGTLVVYALGQGYCKEKGHTFWMTMIPMHMGDIPMGDWKVTVERLNETD